MRIISIVLLQMHSLGSLEGQGEVLSLVFWSQLIVGDLVRQEGVNDGTERQAVRPAGFEILDFYILDEQQNKEHQQAFAHSTGKSYKHEQV